LGRCRGGTIVAPALPDNGSAVLHGGCYYSGRTFGSSWLCSGSLPTFYNCTFMGCSSLEALLLYCRTGLNAMIGLDQSTKSRLLEHAKVKVRIRQQATVWVSGPEIKLGANSA
jgi:hypothetical protein